MTARILTSYFLPNQKSLLFLKLCQLFYIIKITILSMNAFNFALAGDLSSGYGSPEISYRGIFDKRIYDQSLDKIIAGKIIGHLEFEKEISGPLAEKIAKLLTERQGIDL